MSNLEGNDENLGMGREMYHGKEGVKAENHAPFFRGVERQGEGTEGRGWDQKIRSRGTAGI